jgi:signal transduction histidine kinase
MQQAEWRQRLFARILVISIILLSLVLGANLLSLLTRQREPETNSWILALVLVVLGFSYWANHKGYVWAGMPFVLMLVLAVTFIQPPTESFSGSNILAFMIPMIASTYLISPNAVFILAPLIVGDLYLLAYWAGEGYWGVYPSRTTIASIVLTAVVSWAGAIATQNALRRERKLSEHLEEMVMERTRELREAQEELVRKEKLAMLGQLAGGVGHELRNPLGVIKNAAYFLGMVLESPEPEVQETLEILENEVATSEKIISSLFDYARARPPTRRKVDVNDLIRAALSRNVAPENVETVCRLDETLPVILADPDQLKQVFGNVIFNGIQAMPDGGQLTVESKVSDDGWIVVSIADTGIGILEENLDKVFEPLFTTKAKGIGLGLAIVKTRLEEHGGSIEAQSEAGKGSVFTIKLPLTVKNEAAEG